MVQRDVVKKIFGNSDKVSREVFIRRVSKSFILEMVRNKDGLTTSIIDKSYSTYDN